MDRTRIVAQIDEVLPLATKAFEPPSGDADGSIRLAQESVQLHDRAKPLIDALAQQPELQSENARMIEHVGMSTGFEALNAWQNLLKLAIACGAEAAVSWLERVAGTDRAPIRIVSEVHGLELPGGEATVNGVHFIRFGELPDSPQTTIIKSSYNTVPLFHYTPPPTAAAIIEIANVPLRTRAEQNTIPDADRFFQSQLESIRRTVQAFTAAGAAAPVVSCSWSEYLNNDLAHAAFGFGWHAGLSDAPRFHIRMTVDQEAIDFVQRYFAVSVDLSRKLDIATARLNLARRRNVIADQAIDGSICLEALLGEDRFDLTYKLALRAALLVGQDIDDRLRVMQAIKRFYQVRSAAVHGSEKTITPKLIQDVNAGLEICARVIRRMAVLRYADLPEVRTQRAGAQLDIAGLFAVRKPESALSVLFSELSTGQEARAVPASGLCMPCVFTDD